MAEPSTSSHNGKKERRCKFLSPYRRHIMISTKRITQILLADDHQIVREGLRALLARQPDFEVIGETADGASTVKFAKKHLPDIVIMDVTMPNLNGIEATRQI